MSLSGGVFEVIKVGQADNKFSLGEAEFSLISTTSVTMFILGMAMFIQDFTINQNYVQRFMASRSEKDAKFGLVLNMGLLMLAVFLVLFLGVCLFAFYSTQPQLLLQEHIITLKSDAIYPHFIANYIPPGFKNLMIASIPSCCHEQYGFLFK